MKKTGGFKLAIDKKGGYYFEIAAGLIFVILLSLFIYSVVFSTGMIKKVFNSSGTSLQPDTVFEVEKANQLGKVKNFSGNNLEIVIISPSPSPLR